MKKNFRVVEARLEPCICKRCGAEFDISELVYGVPLKGHTDYTEHPHWYCPTEDCNGFLMSGVYFKYDLPA